MTARASRTIGSHSSSRAGGRVVVPAPAPVDPEPVGPCDIAPPPDGAVDDAPEAPADASGAARPSIMAGSPGAMLDSSTSKRSTANRVGALGSSGASDGRGEPDAAGSAIAPGDGDRPPEPAPCVVGTFPD